MPIGQALSQSVPRAKYKWELASVWRRGGSSGTSVTTVVLVPVLWSQPALPFFARHTAVVAILIGCKMRACWFRD